MEVSTKERIPKPPYRHLRHFAFDPSLSRRIGTCGINEVVANLPWDNDLKIGPMDDYLEVVDYDPASQVFYAPVDLNDPLILAQDGLPPSVGSPQFHQQMVYAVARTTIAHFEKALGRRALWAPHLNLNAPGNKQTEYVGRLRIYPHALREANAYYSPAKKALLFGYFPAEAADQSDNYPGEIVFGCLSHDIIAHETTHALLDGMHARFIEPSNEDVLAFHEAFADIVALFQHFTYPEVLRHQIARTRGDLKSENLLGELAFQFGQAIGNRGALRSAIGDYDKNGNWVPETPDPEKIHTLTEVHARGSILVAAVFDAFNMIYKSRIASVIRVATGGTGILPEGELYPDLVDSLAEEAAKTAGQILQICIRALDYCPPVDINFGDYLRALITADYDLVADDRYNYRLAFIQAFRQRGIYPHDVRNMSVESLVWDRPEHPEVFKEVFTGDFLKDIMGRKTDTGSRKQMFYQAQKNQARFHAKLAKSPLMIAEAKIVQKSKKLTFFRDSP
ncbi:MAG: peptidase S8, partial [Chloroflexi bacterium]|nr:peptidase S8 [Chloroflexota bacterium]